LAERALAQAALQRSEARYRSLTLASVSIVWIATDTGDFAAELPSWQAYTGQSRASYEGWGWLEAVHPEDRERVAATWREALAMRTVYQSEYRLARHDGEYRRVTARAVPVPSPDATLAEWVGTCTDVEEERRATEYLRQAQRIEAVGGLAGGVAHEVNNMMTAVTGFGEFVLRELGPEHPQRRDVEEMVKAGTRAAIITRQLLAFSRQQVLQPSVLELNDVVSDLTRMLGRLLGADVQLSVRLSSNAGRVRADRGQLEQVIVNLVMNARDAMPAGGSLTLETADVMLDASYAARHPGVIVKPGPYAMLVLTDTGKGMDAATRAGAFEPFYTTKPVGQGTGLGLSTVYGIMKQSGGYVWLYSEVGRGTSVKLYLPRIADPVSGPTPPETAPRHGHETVLIVEDEDAVRALARRALQASGYTVLEAPDGRTALELVRSRLLPIDLVVCDVVMPEMSGHEFGSQLALENPGIPVIYMSGYPGSQVIARGLIPPGAPFVEKPFTAASLGHWVRTLLDRRDMVQSDPT
jgi:PAS domain S-box-containing protein